MAFTESRMMALGTKAPDFTLPDTVSGEKKSLDELTGEIGTVIMFICNHCPYVKHVNREIVRTATEYQEKGISFVAISSNDIEDYPEDSPENMKAMAQKMGYPFPYLYDETQEVAKAYMAACTPEFYLFDENNELYYRGRLDESRPGNDIPPSGEDLRHALNNLIDGQDPPEKQYPSAGCNIKWKRTV